MEFNARYLFYLLGIFSYSIPAYAEDRLTDGKYATERQFPYQISLQIEGRQHRCGGGIIGERFILTAAHCVTDASKEFEKSRFKVLVDTTDLNDLKKGRSIDVEKIYIPQSYWQAGFRDDISVLKLKQDINLTNGLSKLELPRFGKFYVGEIARVAGFGWFWKKDSQHGATDYKLKYLDVRIIANDKCKIEEGTIKAIYDTNICGQAIPHSNARITGAGVCNGDSGGPLVFGNTVIGIVSLGTLKCQENLAFSRYTRVSSFVLFIDNVLRGIQTTGMRIHNIDGSDQDNGILFPEDRK